MGKKEEKDKNKKLVDLNKETPEARKARMEATDGGRMHRPRVMASKLRKIKNAIAEKEKNNM